MTSRSLAHELIAACTTGDILGVRAAMLAMRDLPPLENANVAIEAAQIAGMLTRVLSEVLDEPTAELCEQMRSTDPRL